MTRHRNPNSWTVVRLPESDLAEVVLVLASPLLAKLGADASIDRVRSALSLAIEFWNTSVLASKLWEHPRVKELNQLKKRLRGRPASPQDAVIYHLLTERRQEHWLDPRLVESWICDAEESGVRRLTCTVGWVPAPSAWVPPDNKVLPCEPRTSSSGTQLVCGAGKAVKYQRERHGKQFGGRVRFRGADPRSQAQSADQIRPCAESNRERTSTGVMARLLVESSRCNYDQDR